MSDGKILVVEDEEDIREILKETLEAKGFHVDTASEGKEGLEKILAGNYDIVLSDVNMPNGMDGFTMCSELEKQVSENYPIIIMMTGYLDNFDTAADYKVIHKCMKKPFSGIKVAKELKELLEKNKS